MGVRYTPAAIRDIGQRACPAIAKSYDAIGPSLKGADQFKSDAFGTHGAGASWVELFDLLKTALVESPVSIRAMGRSLVEAADQYDATEQDNVVNLEDILGDLESDFQDNREEVIDEREAAAEAEEQYLRDQGDLTNPKPI